MTAKILRNISSKFLIFFGNNRGPFKWLWTLLLNLSWHVPNNPKNIVSRYCKKQNSDFSKIIVGKVSYSMQADQHLRTHLTLTYIV